MKADYIKEIIRDYEKMPYDCILVDGIWGIGKTEAVRDALKDCKNSCFVSLFGLKDVQQIFHETFYQLGIKDKKGVSEMISKVGNIISLLNPTAKIAKEILASLIKEKELFLELAKKFKELHVIVIDDLERMNNNTNIEELFGIIDEIKRCKNVKVILIANTQELKEKKTFEKYSEKVIDRIYEMTEHTSNIDWKRLNIDSDFINEFLKIHKVQNLRTLQKAQKLYEDVRMHLKGDYADEFYDEIRLVCYAIVVETIDGLYNGENDDKKNDTNSKMAGHLSNRLDVRIKSNYLYGVCISGNMVDIIHKYYENKEMIDSSEIDGEYQIFLHAGDKANFYKSDEEIREVLTKIENDIRTENMLGKLIKYADEYFIWSEKLGLDIGPIREEYKQKLHDMIYPEIINGKLEFLSYGLDSNMQSEINQKIAQDVILKIRIELIERYMQYLSENMQDELAYEYSYNLRKFVNNVNYRNIIFENIDKLYNKKLFPINDVTEIQYWTSYNIMYVLYVENEKRFLDYCNKIKTECDHMAAHRINTVIKQISEKSSNGMF